MEKTFYTSLVLNKVRTGNIFKDINFKKSVYYVANIDKTNHSFAINIPIDDTRSINKFRKWFRLILTSDTNDARMKMLTDAVAVEGNTVITLRGIWIDSITYSSTIAFIRLKYSTFIREIKNDHF